MKPNSLHELYVEQLKDLYDAEQQIIKALPEMIEAATSTDLKDALSQHLEITREQANRIENIFGELGEKPKGAKCKGMQGVIAEGDDLVGDIKDPDLRDAAIIAAAQRVEHYEMAGYGTARSYAELLEEENSAQLLQQTLDEEREADQKLTGLAARINVQAGAGDLSSEEPGGTTRRKRVA